MSHHSLISVEIDAKSKAYPEVPFNRMTFRNAKADWESFRCYMMEDSLPTLFNQAASKLLLQYLSKRAMYFAPKLIQNCQK